jgi:hypothetical protein
MSVAAVSRGAVITPEMDEACQNIAALVCKDFILKVREVSRKNLRNPDELKDIRNVFYRKTLTADLAKLSGSVRAIADRVVEKVKWFLGGSCEPLREPLDVLLAAASISLENAIYSSSWVYLEQIEK